MEGNIGLRGKWSQLEPQNKCLIFWIIFFSITLCCLIGVTIFLVMTKPNKVGNCPPCPRITTDFKGNVKKSRNTIISKNTTANKEELARAVKFIVSLHYIHVNGTDVAYCVGSILSKNWFLTSSICLHQRLDPKRLYARAGTIFYDKGGSTHPLIHFVLPDWRLGNQDYYTYRYIVLAQVSKPFNINGKSIVPARIPPQFNNEERFTPNYDLFTFGWGTYVSTMVQPKYKKLRIMKSEIYYASASCRNYLQVDELKALRIIENVLCAGNITADSEDQCNIDSGAPLTHLGIISGVSWSGISCNNYPTVYTKVSLFANWILKYIQLELL